MGEMSADLQLKYIIIGPSGVGKSSLLLQYTDSRFSESHTPTIGVEFGIRMIEHNGKLIKLQIWDTAGQESFRSLTSSYYRGSHGALVVYDITNEDSFEHLGTWLDDVKCNTGLDTVITVVGNKLDFEKNREVPKEKGEEFARRHGLHFCEVSAVQSNDIDSLFNQSLQDVLQRMEEGKINPQSNKRYQSTASVGRPPRPTDDPLRGVAK